MSSALTPCQWWWTWICGARSIAGRSDDEQDVQQLGGGRGYGAGESPPLTNVPAVAGILSLRAR
jgi:hypothetical protein